MRFLKQVTYGSLYLIVFALVGLGVYKVYFYETPTCFDGILNQNELSVDCDGTCIPCEIKNAKLETQTISVMRAGEGRVTVLAKVVNPINYNATFEYKINILGTFNTSLQSLSGASSINEESERYIVIPGIALNKDDVSKATIEITNAKWDEDSTTKLPEVELRNLQTVVTDDGARITGRAFNDSLDIIKRVRVTALLLDLGESVLGASAVDVQNIGVAQEKAFTVFFPELDAELGQSEVETKIFSEIIQSP